MEDTIRYILKFLLYGNEEALQEVGYTRDETEKKRYKINILPSEKSPLNCPERDWQDFYPEVRRALESKRIEDDMDIVSVACFLMSRAEEMVVKTRDEHGRFLASHSVLGQKNRLYMPLIDEWGRVLLKRLGREMPKQEISKVNLTHDVDFLTRYRHWRGLMGGLKRGEWGRAAAAVKERERDSVWTFPWMMEKDRGHDVIYFLKASNGKGFDYPQYDLEGKDFKELVRMIAGSGAEIGLHTSYEAGCWHEGRNMIEEERERLEKALQGIYSGRVTKNRHHYLRSTTIDNMQQLADSGIEDDYTMGFADHAGFRLQTARVVSWINPKTLRVTGLRLHPLTVMDVSLTNEKYMQLSEDEAYYVCEKLIDKTRQNGGELNLLWHNNSFVSEQQRRLYEQVVGMTSAMNG